MSNVVRVVYKVSARELADDSFDLMEVVNKLKLSIKENHFVKSDFTIEFQNTIFGGVDVSVSAKV